MPQKKFIGAGLYDAIIKDSAGNEYDMFAVRSAESDPQREEVEIKGDDQLLGVFAFGLSDDLTLVANGVNFDVVMAVTGNSVSSSDEGIKIPLGTDSEGNPPYVEVRAYSKAKDDQGVAVNIVRTWYKVQITAINFSQQGEQEFNVEMTGKALQTEEDVEGNALASKRIGDLEVTGYSA